MSEDEKSNGLDASSNLAPEENTEIGSEVDSIKKMSDSDLSFSDLLKRFRAQSAGVISEYRRKSVYVPASVRRAEKQAKARSRSRKR